METEIIYNDAGKYAVIKTAAKLTLKKDEVVQIFDDLVEELFSYLEQKGMEAWCAHENISALQNPNNGQNYLGLEVLSHTVKFEKCQI